MERLDRATSTQRIEHSRTFPIKRYRFNPNKFNHFYMFEAFTYSKHILMRFRFRINNGSIRDFDENRCFFI